MDLDDLCGLGALDRLLSDFVERTLEEGGSEAFLSIASGEGYRLGVTAERTGNRIEETIELMLRLYRPGDRIDASALAARCRFVSLVQDRGYSALHLDQGWVCCTLSAGNVRTSSELAAMLGMVRECIP